ncbi:MAG: low molecular weight protein-tyrosine-phosphatase [Pseudomonadota bacterium]
MRILAVCLGNICRSPTAEAVLRAQVPGAEIDSAGTSNWHIGDAPYPPAVEAAAARGYDLTPLRARQVTAEDFHRFDLILAMDAKNLSDLQAMRPSGARAEVRLMLSYAPVAGQTDVPDPYYTRDFEGALDLIEAAADGLKNALQTP